MLLQIIFGLIFVALLFYVVWAIVKPACQRDAENCSFPNCECGSKNQLFSVD